MPTTPAILLGLLMVTVLRRCAVAAFDPEPEMVQAAVKHSILTLILLDAATAAAIAGPVSGLALPCCSCRHSCLAAGYIRRRSVVSCQ